VWSRDVVQIDNSTFNFTSAFRGGAIFLSGGNATLVAQGLTIFFSSARNSGGGIHAREGASVILKQNNLIKWNSAGANGGGAYLYLNSRLSILGNSTFESNVVLEDSNEYGGAAISAHEDSLVEIEDRAILQNNQAIFSAGGCLRATHGCIITIRDDAQIINNTATSGGAIFADQKARINISGNVKIEGNIAVWYSGGALYLGSMSQANDPLSGVGPVQLFVSGHVTFKNNHAEDSGGAIGLSGGYLGSPYTTRSHVYLSEHVSFIENSAQWLGGAIYSERTGTIKSEGLVSFLRNQAGETGGAICAEGRTLVSIAGKTTLSRNFAGISAGAVGLNGADLEINDQVLIQENSALSYGGAVSSRGQSHMSIDGGPNFEHNCAKYGGGLFVGQLGLLDINGQANFVANHAEIGGALNIQDAELIADGKVVFSANDALLQGGAVSSSGKVNLHFRGVSLIRNQAGQQGGAIYLERESELKVEDGVFEENSAQRFEKSTCMNIISKVDESDSWQETFGGAMSVNGKSTVVVTGDSILSKNRAAVGGAILIRYFLFVSSQCQVALGGIIST
jgi:predicted outer membrane repeat protein